MSLSGKDNKKPDNRGKALSLELKNYSKEIEEQQYKSGSLPNQYKSVMQGKLEANPEIK